MCVCVCVRACVRAYSVTSADYHTHTHAHSYILLNKLYNDVSTTTKLTGAEVYSLCYSLHFTVATEHLLVTCVFHHLQVMVSSFRRTITKLLVVYIQDSVNNND